LNDEITLNVKQYDFNHTRYLLSLPHAALIPPRTHLC